MLKPTYKYIINNLYKHALMFYGVLVGILIALAIVSKVYNNQGTVSGLELASFIFLYIFGFFIFKELFHFLISNSISRRTMYIGLLMSFGTIALIMSVLNFIIELILIKGDYFSTIYVSLFDQLFYVGNDGNLSNSISNLRGGALALRTIESITFCFIANLISMIIPYIISTVFYRLSIKARIVSAISIIAFVNFAPLFIGMSDTLANALIKVIDFFNNVILGKSINLILFMLCFLIISSIVGWLVTRKIKINESALKG